ncbi:hypothetical protein QFC19_000610 [Naganishia cerealis]|uniref:Uncharacterized protein n=1 Tax=Naganishia cerealis TaxID=610337 RepID=A0ACC2WNC4_9TREE|nr:hypothetical protein QFC19_000610 [Naganishia cerealis]
MLEKAEEAFQESGRPVTPTDLKGIEDEADYNLTTLPQEEDVEGEVAKNAFLPRRTEAIMMTAICIALFGEFVPMWR